MSTASRQLSSALSTVVVTELGDLAPDWDRLVEWAPVPTPFLRSWWLAAAVPAGRARYVLFFDDAERPVLVGGLAVQEHRSFLGVRRYRSCADGALCPDHLDLLALPGHESDVCRALEVWLSGGARLLELDGVVQHSLLSGLPHSATSEIGVAPWDPLPESGPDFFARLSANTRKAQRAARRRMVALGVETHRVEPAEVAGTLDAFVDLHRARPDRGPLLAELPRLRAALVAGYAAGEVQLDVLRRAGCTLAVLISFRTAGALRMYQLARPVDERLPSAGSVLLATAIERACDEGCYEIDLLRGDESYKFRFVGHTRAICRFQLARGMRARCLLAAIRALRRTRRTAGQVVGTVRAGSARAPSAGGRNGGA